MPTLRLEVVNDPDAMVLMRGQIEALCEDLCEPNVFYEPWMLIPALRQLGEGETFRFLCLYEAKGSGRLCGFFPLVRSVLHQQLPLPAYGLWQHSQCFRCTPLIRQGFAERCWQGVFAWLAGEPAHRRLLRLKPLPANGPVSRALHQILERTPSLGHVATLHETAFLRIGESGDAALRRAMSSKTQATLRRKQRRLQDDGEVTIHELADEPDLSGSIEEFLRLEASGWKGNAGTALAAKANEAEFFRQVISEARRRNRLSLLCMRQDGRMIAGRSVLLAAPGSYVFKIAFDESLSRFSPGLLLEMEEVRRLHDPNDPRHARITWSDSCAAPDNGPFYRCWPERETMAELRLTSGWGPHRLAVTLWPLLHGAKRALRRVSGLTG